MEKEPCQVMPGAACERVLFFFFYVKMLIFQTLPRDEELIKPGRQMTVFFFMFNAAQWLVFTFEVQKVIK